MWRKIHSNRDPRDTLYSEIRKEFSPYFGKAGNLGKGILGRNPKFFFGLMVSAMVVSMALALTLFRHPEPARLDPNKKVLIGPVDEGFTKIIRTSGKIRETLRLKSLVDSISQKKQLSEADSILLDSALDELQRIKTTK